MTATTKRIATSSFVLLAENIVRLAAVAAVSFWIARALGPAQFGILNFGSALMAILLSVSALGMDVPTILRLTRAPNPGAVMGTVLAIRGAASLFVFLIAVLLAFWLKRKDVTALLATIIISTCIVAYTANALDLWFNARTSAMGPALARTMATLLSVAAKVACLVLVLGVIALAWTIVLEALLAALGLLWAFQWNTKGSIRDTLSMDWSMVNPMLRESMPFFFSSVAVLLYMKADVVMLGYFSTNLETGIYGLAQKLSEVIYVVPGVLVSSAYPTLVRRFLDTSETRESSGQMLFDLAIGGSIAAVLLSIALAGPVITLVFGKAYQPAVHIFYVHSWSCIAIAMNETRQRWFAALSLQRYAPTVTAFGLVINIAMNLFMIPWKGAEGAAITTVVSYFISAYLTSFIFAPLRKIGIAQTRALWPWRRLYQAARLWQRNRQLSRVAE